MSFSNNFGTSGSTFELNGNCLSKFAPINKANPHFIHNAMKQASFKASGEIAAPEVFSIRSATMDYFTMQHIDGQMVHDWSEEAKQYVINNLISFIKSNIVGHIHINGRTFVNWLDTMAVPEPAIRYVTECKNALGAGLDLPVGYAHDDLTLCNVILKDKIYLIDFHTAVISSPGMDIIKLLQDVHVGWYKHLHNKDGSHSLNVAGLQACKDSFEESWLDTHYTYLQMLNLLRIFAYTNDIRTHKFLLEKLCQLSFLP